MLALGWTLFVALYFIGFACVLAHNIASYRGGLIPWTWKWSLLAWPWLMMGDAWDRRQAVYDVLTRRAVKL